MSRKQTIFLCVFLVVSLVTSISMNILQSFNVTKVEKVIYVEVPVEVPVEIPQTSVLKQSYIKGRFDVQFYDSFDFIDGTFEFADVWFMAPWDCHVTFRHCKIKNVTFTLTMLQVKLENCMVQNSYFEDGGSQPAVVYLSETSFTGHTTFDVNVVNGTGNTGLENVTFKGRVFQEE